MKLHNQKAKCLAFDYVRHFIITNLRRINMNKNTTHASSPFDDSAIDHHRRMGLIREDGKVNIPAVTALAHVYAGLFFDALCDDCDEYETVFKICRTLIDLAHTTQPKRILLALCTEYDAMRRPLPEPIWWISGSNEIVPLFMRSFLHWLEKLL
jgi:hypothetical protein